jgi:hypothetical protein
MDLNARAQVVRREVDLGNAQASEVVETLDERRQRLGRQYRDKLQSIGRTVLVGSWRTGRLQRPTGGHLLLQ